MTSLDYFQGLNKTPAWYMGDVTCTYISSYSSCALGGALEFSPYTKIPADPARNPVSS